MPRPRKSSSNAQLSPGQASYVLQRLIRDRRVSAGEVSRYVSDMQREITELEERLEALRQASGSASSQTGGQRRRGRPPAQASSQQSQGGGQGGAQRRRGRAITAEQRQSRVIQGRYLGLIRQIPASRRGQYQKIAKEKGREAAIKEMASALGK